jgi:peptide/nickel transport system permease protein
MQASAVVLKLAKTKKKRQDTFSVAFRTLARNPSAMIGLVIIVVISLVAIFSPLIMPYSVTKIDIRHAYALPSSTHLLGTDDLGRDILSRIMFGARYSLMLGIFSTILGLVAGIIIGSISGYFGGWVDDVIMRFFDIIQAIPGILLSITVATVLGAGLIPTMLSLAIASVPMYARILRAQILSVRKMEYVEAAIAINCSVPRIISDHIIPNAITPLIVQAAMGVAQQILAAATLSFVGLGVQPPTPEWGAMLTAGRAFIRDHPHIVLFPGLMIIITVLSLNMIGDGLRDALDPKLKK